MKTKAKVGLTVVAAVVYWVIVSWLMGCHRKKQPELPTVILIDRSQVNDAILQQDYLEYDKLYFDNKMPRNTVVVSLGPAYAYGKDNMGITERVDGVFFIQINPVFHPTQKQMDITLLHEMCHVVTWGSSDGPKTQRKRHGPEWQACMLDLAEDGAFDDLW